MSMACADQGSRYNSFDFTATLSGLNIKISMGSKGESIR